MRKTVKISQIEAVLCRGDITDENISAFKTALRRVPKAARCQHCYTTAVSFPKEEWEAAVALIRYGLETCECCWVDRMRAYSNMADVYERSGDYAGALEAYQNALDAVEDTVHEDYAPSLAADMLRVELHLSGFVYTDRLRQYYDLAIQEDDFEASFKHRVFYRAVAEMLIFSHEGKRAEAEAAYSRAKEVLSPSHLGPVTAILMRHRYLDHARATKEAVWFLKRWNVRSLRRRGRIR